MKKLFMPLLALSLMFAVGCNNAETKDSTEVAEEANEQKADSTNAGKKMEDDHEFMIFAASGGLMEVELGKLASTNASSAKVKDFGTKMVTDHSKANQELMVLASQKNISIPSTPGTDHQKHIDDLREKKGAEFDKAYMSMMVMDHEEDVKKFEEASTDGKDADVKAFAAKTLPVLKQHHAIAKTINDEMK